VLAAGVQLDEPAERPATLNPADQDQPTICCAAARIASAAARIPAATTFRPIRAYPARQGGEWPAKFT